MVVGDGDGVDIHACGHAGEDRPRQRVGQHGCRDAADLQPGRQVGQEVPLARSVGADGDAEDFGLADDHPFGHQQLGQPASQLPALTGAGPGQRGNPWRVSQNPLAVVDLGDRHGRAVHRRDDHRTVTATAGVDSSGNRGLSGAAGGAATGGAVASDGRSTVVNTTFYGNSAVGGAGGTGGSGYVFSGNGGNGGNAYGGGFSSTGSAALTNCTFSTCAATGGTNGVSGGRTAVDGSLGLTHGDNLAGAGGALLLKNSLLAAGVNGQNGYGSITDQGNNLSSDATPVFTRPTSRQPLDPQLDVLNANGGPTLTMALLRGSPAIDAAENLPFPLFDQRGSLRPTLTYSNYADIGASEFGVNYSVSGFVSLGGVGLSGIPVSATNSSGQVFSTVTTNGAYLLNLVPGHFSVSPQPAGAFAPSSRSVALFTNVVNVNFSLVNAGPATIARAASPASPQSLVLSFATIPNQVYRIQTSTNLVNWTGVLTNTATGSGPVYFTNTIATNIPYRFVRLVSP